MDQWDLLLLPLLSAIAGLVIGVLLLRRIARRLTHPDLTAKLAGFFSNSSELREEVQARLSDPAVFHASAPLINAHIDDFLRNRLSQAMPFISHFIGDKTIESLKKLFMEKLEELFPQMMREFAAQGKTGSQLSAAIAAKLKTALAGRIRELLWPEAKALLLIAALAGFIFGLLEVVILYLVR